MCGRAANHPLPGRKQLTVADYESGVIAGDRGVLARAVTLMESSLPEHRPLAEELLARLLPRAGGAIRLGITGPPGAGKSTFIEALGLHLVALGKRVAVLAVDPTSGTTGGSILGDKTRMSQLAAEPAVFIRPSPSAGTLGGLAIRTRESIFVCEAAGYDVVLVETVGVGQSDSHVADMTDCCLALVLPGAGDELQGIKRGLLEIVDLIVVNKADGATQSAAQLAARQYEGALHILRAGGEQEPPVVLTCSALERVNVDAVWDAVVDRRGRMETASELTRRRQRQNVHWLHSVVQERLLHALDRHPGVRSMREELERQVSEGSLSVEAAAGRMLAALGVEATDPPSHLS